MAGHGFPVGQGNGQQSTRRALFLHSALERYTWRGDDVHRDQMDHLPTRSNPHDLGPDWSVAPSSSWPVACTILFLMVLPLGIRIMRWSKRRPPMEHHPDRNRRPRSTCSSSHRCGTTVAALLMPLRNTGPWATDAHTSQTPCPRRKLAPLSLKLDMTIKNARPPQAGFSHTPALPICQNQTEQL
jgi:hypothetical protein